MPLPRKPRAGLVDAHNRELADDAAPGWTSRVSRCRRRRLRRAIGLPFDADAAPLAGPRQRRLNRPTPLSPRTRACSSDAVAHSMIQPPTRARRSGPVTLAGAAASPSAAPGYTDGTPSSSRRLSRGMPSPVLLMSPFPKPHQRSLLCWLGGRSSPPRSENGATKKQRTCVEGPRRLEGHSSWCQGFLAPHSGQCHPGRQKDGPPGCGRPRDSWSRRENPFQGQLRP